ncbi:hypothetical protein [Candidatus Soleaferrea massiliensis]|uniref:hypothetical protein n=1 Tax=Candidatus Soleaferrea massiliensis TaxID=1470354 RepID=UPI00058D6395|nr:hypothetical protein [Candidatus Soleaferrea massiliensis]
MKLKASYLVLIFGVLLALPIRIIELIAFIDGKTGFSLEGDFIAPVLYAILVLTIVASILFSYLNRSHPSIILDRDKPLYILTLVLGGSFVVRCVMDIIRAFGVTGDSTFRIIISFFGILIGVILLYMGVCQMKYNTIFSAFLSVLPAIWVVLRLLQLFTEYTTIISVSEHLFKLLFYVFIALFMVGMARIWSHTQPDKGSRGVFAYGIPAVVIGVLVTIPPIIAQLKGSTSLMEFVWSETLLELALTAFAAYMVLYLKRRDRDAQLALEEEPEDISEEVLEETTETE